MVRIRDIKYAFEIFVSYNVQKLIFLPKTALFAT